LSRWLREIDSRNERGRKKKESDRLENLFHEVERKEEKGKVKKRREKASGTSAHTGTGEV